MKNSLLMNFNSVFEPKPKISDIVTSKERRREFKAKKREAKHRETIKSHYLRQQELYGINAQKRYDIERSLKLVELRWFYNTPDNLVTQEDYENYFVEQGLLEPRIIFE